MCIEPLFVAPRLLQYIQQRTKQPYLRNTYNYLRNRQNDSYYYLYSWRLYGCAVMQFGSVTAPTETLLLHFQLLNPTDSI